MPTELAALAALNLSPQTWAYAGFLVLLAVFLTIDLGVLNRKAHVIGVRESLLWSSLWVSLAVAFSVFVYYAYERHWLDLGVEREISGSTATIDYLSAYLLEYALSVDNIFVIATIFKYFATPPQHQHRVLFWGIVGVVVMRGALIAAGGWLTNRFDWTFYVFGGVLILSAAKMLALKEETISIETNVVARTARRFFRFSRDYDGARFFTRLDGRRLATPMLLVLLMVESADVVFALDSVPAVYGVTKEPFIVFTSNMFAILGLRSLFFALSAFIEKFRYLKVSLAFILIYLGVKMILHVPDWLHITAGQNLAIITGILAVGMTASVVDDRGRRLAEEAFLGPDVEWVAREALKQARKLVIFVIGGTILLIGVVMIVAPGPAILVIPMGLAILATEFIWARRLLRRFKRGAGHVGKKARGGFDFVKRLSRKVREWFGFGKKLPPPAGEPPPAPPPLD